MFAMLMHAASGLPHVHGDDPIVAIAIGAMLAGAIACLWGARVRK